MIRDFRTVSQKEREEIIQEKINNPFIKTSILAEKYNLKSSAVASFLTRNNVSTLNLTGVRYRKYNVNDNFFETIDTPEKAYLLGVWYSDGYLVIEGTKTKRIGLDVKDEDWLLSIKEALQSEAPLYKTAKENIKRFKVTSPKLYDDLIKQGCLENKTFILKFPNEDQVPFELLNSFILGFLDGDGSIVISKSRQKNYNSNIHINFTGTKEMLIGIQKYLKVEHLTLGQRHPERHNNNYTLNISGIQQVYKILNLLYKDAPKCILQRKFNKYKQIINDSRVLLKDKMLIPANPNDNGV